MSKKFEKIVNAPHKVFGRAKDKLLGWKIEGENPKIKIETKDKTVTITVPEKEFKKGVRAAGVSVTGLGQFLFWAAKYLTLDNHLTRQLEKAFANKKGSKKKIKHPNLVGHLVYYVLVAMVSGATWLGVRAYDNDKQDDEVKDKIENVEVTGSDDKPGVLRNARDWLRNLFGASEKTEEIRVIPGTYGEYRARMQPVVPMIVAEIVAMEGAVMRDGMHVVYDDATMKPLKPGQKPRGKATQGYGNTVRKDKKELDSNSPPITSEEALEWVRWHLEDKETFLLMYCYEVACKDANVNSVPEAMAIASMMYNGGILVLEKDSPNVRNRFEEIRKLHRERGDALSEDEIKAIFKKYPIKDMAHVGKHWLTGGSVKDAAGWYINVDKDGDGIRWRRWLEACIMTGDITVEEILNIPVNYMSDFFDLVGRDRKNWFIVKNEGKANETRTVNRETVVRFREWVKNPVAKDGRTSLAQKQRVRDVMPKDAVQMCMADNIKLDKKVKKYKKTKKQKIVEKETYVIGYEQEYAAALEAYQKENFEDAARQYEALVLKYPDNALLRNDLAATYNHLERYEDAIAQVREIVWRIGDKTRYGAAQYNAGFAYEQMGDLEKACENYRLAVANGNQNAEDDLKRVTQALKNKTKTKKVAFNDAAGRVESYGQTADFLSYLEEVQHRNNDNA